MTVELNHTIITASDKAASAAFLADLLGLQVGEPYGPFLPVETHNRVTLDYLDAGQERISPQHYAFLVSEAEFDVVLDRVQRAGVTFYADPAYEQPGRINHGDGGRGAYFRDPDGHSMEILTRPYGSGQTQR
ncbi:VOC family protein [Salinifilum aidingensis]